MKTTLLIIFGVLSVAVNLAFLARAVYLHKCVKRTERVLSSVQVYTIGTFLSVLAVFIPIYYTDFYFTECNFVDSHLYIRPLLMAIHNSIRIFILDGGFDTVINAVNGQKELLQILFSLNAAVLYVIAPVLTFSNVLSLFKNIRGEIRYKWNKRKKHYIMSELNEKSIALAESIYEKDKKCIIVFADVFEQNEEDDYELLSRTKDIRAICLKKDVAHLDIISKKGDVEIFLIGEDESENVSQAVKITTELNKKNKKYNVKVFVFSSKPAASYIIDSVRYDNLLQHAVSHDYGRDCFKLRRINEKQQLIWNTVPKMKLFDLADRNDKTLSVLIVGFGSYGTEFFKMLLWYCQFEGYKLKINIVDKEGDSEDTKDHIRSQINRAYPELLKTNRSASAGDAQYDIEIYSKVDALSADIDELLLGDEDGRLKGTNLVFVSLGDDDNNIEAAIHLRGLFDRIRGIKAQKSIGWRDEAVEIYSVVYDDRKSEILYHEGAAETGSHILTNHQDIPYHIHFIGGLSSQFDYANIYDEALERAAYEHHISWIAVDKLIKKEQNDKNNAHTHPENEEIKDEQTEEEKETEARERKKYEKYEYFRYSSIAKELYRREIQSSKSLSDASRCLEKRKLQTCQCENCTRRKRSEHNRWNAYTRILGYSKSGIRADRALLHNKLCDWSSLTDLDRMKD